MSVPMRMRPHYLHPSALNKQHTAKNTKTKKK